MTISLPGRILKPEPVFGATSYRDSILSAVVFLPATGAVNLRFSPTPPGAFVYGEPVCSFHADADG